MSKISIEMQYVDTYFICQMVSRSLDDVLAYARNIDEFMGDMASIRLTRPFPKYTPLHEYIEYVVESVIWEESDIEVEKLIQEPSRPPMFEKRLWVDHLLQSHSFSMSFLEWANSTEADLSVEEYLLYLREEGILEDLLEAISKEVFHILFSNRKVLLSFGEQAATFLEEAPSFYPNLFTARGYLKRVRIPKWAEKAVYHRDKGICVLCKKDLTMLVNIESAIHYDHVIPLARGGLNDVTNLQCLCSDCNLKKSSSSPAVPNDYQSWYSYR